MQNFLVDHRRLGEAIGAMMLKGGGKGFLDHLCRHGTVRALGM
jgi:hypothetical protein